LQAGITKAVEVIDNGAALEKLNQLIERSNQGQL
jgi:anthranilate phosphoribosyltransferase